MAAASGSTPRPTRWCASWQSSRPAVGPAGSRWTARRSSRFGRCGGRSCTLAGRRRRCAGSSGRRTVTWCPGVTARCWWVQLSRRWDSTSGPPWRGSVRSSTPPRGSHPKWGRRLSSRRASACARRHRMRCLSSVVRSPCRGSCTPVATSGTGSSCPAHREPPGRSPRGPEARSRAQLHGAVPLRQLLRRAHRWCCTL